MDDGGHAPARRSARLLLAAVVALLAWGGLVALAVAEGRELRAGAGSWWLLATWGVGAAVALYAAGMLLLSSRRDAAHPAPRTTPRHRG